MRKVQVCIADVRKFKIRVPSNSEDGVFHEVSGEVGDLGAINCTCKGFKFRKTCSHVEVIFEVCGWAEGEAEESQNGRQRQLRICPRCGSETLDRMHGKSFEEEGSSDEKVLHKDTLRKR